MLEYKPLIDPIPGPPQRHIGILPTGETISITDPTPSTITINNSTYIYCGTSDSMAYYRVKPLFNYFQPINVKNEVNKHWCINCYKHESLHNQTNKGCPND